MHDAQTAFCDVASGRLVVAFDQSRITLANGVVVSWGETGRALLKGPTETLGFQAISNGDFRLGTDGWSLRGDVGGVDFGVDLAEEWSLIDGRTLFVRDSTGSRSSPELVYSAWPAPGGIPVVVGREYLLEALIGTHRCSAEVILQFRGQDGRVLAVAVDRVQPGWRGGEHRPDYHLSSVIAAAPRGSALAAFVIRKGPTLANEPDSFLFVADVRFGRRGRHLPPAVMSPTRAQAITQWITPSLMSVALPSVVLDGATHSVEVRDAETGQALSGSPLLVRQGRVYDGGIEVISGAFVSGWLRSRDGSGHWTATALEVDGIEVDRAEAEPRPDMRFGFRLFIPREFLDRQGHHLLVRAIPDGSVVAERSAVLAVAAPGRAGESRGLTPIIRSRGERTGTRQLEALARETPPNTEHARVQEGHLAQPDETSEPRSIATRRRAAVVAWDVGHNPVGRAFVLADLLRDDWDVDVVGPSWEEFGRGVWAPLRRHDVRVRTWHCRDIGDYVPPVLLDPDGQSYGLVVVSKPRLPSLLHGLLIKEQSGCPLILDIDDDEVGLVGGGTEISIDDLESAPAGALREPYTSLSTRYATSLIPWADALTISNIALRRAHGGYLVRNARDETVFKVSQERRMAVRAELGMAEDEFALMFIGTPHAHSGVLGIAEALQEMDDNSFSLHFVGDFPDVRLRDKLGVLERAQIRFHPKCDYSELPDLLSAGDAVPLLQDPGDPVAESQLPAQLSDALAMGKPVLVTRVEALADIPPSEGVAFVDEEGIEHTLHRLQRERSPARAERIREIFLGEFSLTVNCSRLRHAIARATEGKKALPPDFQRLKSLALRDSAHIARSRQAMTAAIPTRVSAGGRTPRPNPVGGTPRPRELVVFWKQNDTGLYGRRPEMLVKYLLRSGQASKVIYFDAPISVDRLLAISSDARREGVTQDALLLRNTLARWHRELDTATLRQRAFVYRGLTQGQLLGRDLPPLEEYPRFVSDELIEAGVAPGKAVALAYPVVWEFPDVYDSVLFGNVVVDLVDDQRTWPSDPGHRQRLAASYADTIGLADLVLTNCQPVADAFSALHRPIHVIPNGAEHFDLRNLEMPGPLVGLPRPIVGYVGNMRDRINWSLLEGVVARRPDWTFVLAGPSDARPEALELAARPNVCMPGVVEYCDLPKYLAYFDAAIVPHTSSMQAESMNPLKVYNYLAAELPIIASNVPNLADVDQHVITAESPDAFVEALDRALAGFRPGATSDWGDAMMRIGWATRAGQLTSLLEDVLG